MEFLKPEKVGSVHANPEKLLDVSYVIQDHGEEHDLQVFMFKGAEGVRRIESSVLGFTEVSDEQGNMQRRFVRMPEVIRETRHTMVEFYDSHETLIKGIGAVAVVRGVVKAGSLVIRRFKESDIGL